MSLVLDWVDGTLGDPVDLIGKVGGVELGDVVVLEVGWSLVTEDSLGLEFGHGGELVVSEDEGVLGGVDLVDLSILLGEETHSEVVLLLGSEVETMGGNVLHEGLLEFDGDWGFAGEETGVSGHGADHVHV